MVLPAAFYAVKVLSGAAAPELIGAIVRGELDRLVAELKILAGEKSVTAIEVKDDKLMLTRHGDFLTLGGKFPRLTKKEAKARLKEIKKLLLAI